MKIVQYSTRDKLHCGDCPGEVIICVSTSVALSGFINGTVSCPTQQCNVYVYNIQYEEDQLLDPDTGLEFSDIKGVFCRDCFTAWVESISGGGGGACIVEVTTEELNNLVSSSSLNVGCTYIITDFVQGRIVAGARVYLDAISANQLETNCSVLTTYDSEPWRGVYDLATNKLLELSDNQGNTCKQYPPLDPFGPAVAPIEEFDWGNTYITNCLVDNAKWYIDYGVAPASGIDKVQITTTSTLDLRGWVGTWLSGLYISGFSSVDFSNGDAEVEDLWVENGSSVIVNSITSGSFFFISRVDSSFIIVTETSSNIYMEGCFVQGYSGVYHRASGNLGLFSVNISGFGQVRTGGYGGDPVGSVTDAWVENSELSGVANGDPLNGSCIDIRGDNTGDLYFNQLEVTSGGSIRVENCSGDVSIERSSVSSAGLFAIVVTEDSDVDGLVVASGALLNINRDFGAVDILNVNCASDSETNISGTGYFNFSDCEISGRSLINISGEYTGVDFDASTLTGNAAFTCVGHGFILSIFALNMSGGSAAVLEGYGDLQLYQNNLGEASSLTLGEVGSVGSIAFNVNNLHGNGTVIARSVNPLSITQSHVIGGGILNVGGGIMNVENTHISAAGQAWSVGGSLQWVTVTMGILDVGSFNTQYTYLHSVAGKIATAPNNSKGKDYFNDNIV